MDKQLLSYIFQPAYYKDFQCIGGACPQNCCKIHWDIEWSIDSVEKLRSENCSEKIKKLADTAFVKNNATYLLVHDEKGRCPFLSDDDFCLIQREIGTDYLSDVCILYPRRTRYTNDIMIRSCFSSCCHVIDMICNDENALKLEKYIPAVKHVNFMGYTVDNEVMLKKYPELKYRAELFEFFYDILSDKSYDVETAIIIGALAAQKLTDIVEKNKYDYIPQMITELKSQLKKADLKDSIVNIKSIPEVRLGIQSRLCDAITKSTVTTDLIKKGVLTEKMYQKGYANFKEYFAEHNYVLRNIILNFLFELGIPFIKNELTLFENYSYFAAVVASIKLMASISFIKNDDIDNNEYAFKISISKIGRALAHDFYIMDVIFDILNEYNCKSPAYLAAIIK